MGNCCSRFDDLEAPTSRSIPSPESVEDDEDILKKVDPGTVELLPRKKEIIKARVIDVYDGDTCTIIYVYKSVVLGAKIRVLGVDTPEKSVRGKLRGTEIGDLEEKAGLHVTNKVEKLIGGKLISVKMNKFDKYGGRVNGSIFLPKGSKYATLTEYLISKKYAKEYYGTEKEEWTTEELQYILNH